MHIAVEKLRFLPARQVTDDPALLTLRSLVLEPLCLWRHGRAAPGLFARWQHHDEGRRWIFQIRDGAIFHDGTPCDADTILHFIAGIRDAIDTFGMASSYARYLAGCRITALSRRDVQVEAPAPFADILDLFAEFFISRETAEGLPLLGTGPYRVVDYAPERQVRLARVYATAGPAQVTLLAVPLAEDRLRALRDGAVDVAMNLERCEHRLAFDADLDWLRTVNTLSVTAFLNAASGPFARPEARLAVNHAVDGQAIVEEIFFGLGVPATTIVSPAHLGASAAALAPIPYDPEAARRLFDTADIRAPVLIRTPTTTPERAERISQALAEALSAVGVPARIEVQPDRPAYAREASRREIGDMAIFDSTPQSTYRILNDKISSAVRALWWQGHDDPALEALIQRANRTVGDTAREAAYGACLTRLHANPAWLYLFHPIAVAGMRDGCADLMLNARGVIGFHPR
ncbi:ABC transporter substrate-binding protein [Humitalea sp. 24SJ18S-53]|uniref:ABC transporter substrate-binding protein n=1 Tax=Humitalea sp. 24SJ18S-53 TaxID=3422307 RepID=UPI003D67D4AE